jgi:hypothetical protein
VALSEPVFEIVAAISEQTGVSNQSAKDAIHGWCLSPQTRQRSGGATLVPMVKPAHLGDCNNAPCVWWLDRAGLWGVLLQA